MGQFKPMVKMETTEPSVELKLAKGGHVNMKKGGKAEGGHKKMAMGGGALAALAGTPALIGRPAVNASVRAPGKPSMASRRKAMMAKKPAMMPSGPEMGMPPMKKGGKAEGGESKATHKAEMSKMKGLEKELKSHESKPASKGHKGLKTGGVALGNAGGFKTGGVALGNAGGFKTGGVTMGNGGGYKAGGKTSKKAYAAGGTVNSGRPVAMPQGRKPAPKPVAINELAGVYKAGGKVTPAQGRLQKISDVENAPAFRAAKKNTNEKYGPASMMKLAEGGTVDLSKGAYDKAIGPSEEDMDMAKTIRGIPGKLFRGAKSLMGMDKAPKSESVTKTKESVTVTPAKKRGGSVKC